MFGDLGVLGLLGGVCKIQTLHDHYKKLYIVGRICNPEKRYPYMDEKHHFGGVRCCGWVSQNCQCCSLGLPWHSYTMKYPKTPLQLFRPLD